MPPRDLPFGTERFEHDYILAQLNTLAFDLMERVPAKTVIKEVALDRCACILTAFMVGMVHRAAKQGRSDGEL